MQMSDEALARVTDGRAWADFCDRLKAAGQVVLGAEAAPLPLDRTEGWRYLSRLTRLGLEMMVECADPEFPTLYSATTPTIKVGGDNPDNLYQNATISARHQGKVGVRGPGVRKRNANGGVVVVFGKVVRIARRTSDHHRKRTFPLP
jgi:hypothetical protein